MNRLLTLMGTFVLLILVACRASPEPLVAGEDHCGQCRMTITDLRFGAEIITAKGRVLKFDSVSCLTGFLAETAEKPARVLVADFLSPESLIDADQAYFLRSENLKGPMGSGVAASSDEAGLRKLQVSVKGEWLRWKDLSASSH